ncbi:MAG TPA: ABC transporter transmembrane domain-containing protein [Geminicoccus sp.]|uniref:ABCB family ABC transporter ATP-binding protein/permease n=1 Tax=Geminicoccus sp. TaxID=2024832 RepID=UPI002CEB67D4|nr:ABC transporter transmembrane domain-containing protein [Geminicoccus sp.]HWL67390.1 ABC transporter transmembrane domain-containing protein [Geminicoccus sp.]
MTRDMPAPAGQLPSFRALLKVFWPRDLPGLRLRFGGTIALLASAAAINALVPLLFAALVDELSGTHAAAVAPAAILAGYVLLQWCSRLGNELRWMLYGPLEQRLRRQVGLKALEHLHGLSLRFHLDRRTGQIANILGNGLDGLREVLFNVVFLILPLLIEILFVAAVMLVRVAPFFALVLFCTLAVYLVVLVVGSEWLRGHQKQAASRRAAAHGEAIDSLLNYETVKYFGSEAEIARRYDESLAEVETLTVRALTFRSLTGIALVSILAVGMTAILFTALGRVQAGSMTVGDLVLVNTYLLQLVRPMERLGQLYRQIKQSLVDLELLLELMAETPDISDRPDARPLRPGQGEIRFERVSFRYGDDRPILTDLDFTVSAGQKVALVGPTGSGKSTVTRLLFRFYDPTAGRILVDGQDIRTVTLTSLRQAIAVVPQDTVLFNQTLAYNIGFGRPDATPAEIEAAAEAAELDAFIRILPDGYATLVGERGLKLSGGEKQRVAIARAILKRPRIVILDEATSALDATTEEAVQTNLARLVQGVTSLVVAHRLSTVVDADEILVLDEGRIVERGTHAELLTRGGMYAELWARQSSVEDPLTNA